ERPDEHLLSVVERDMLFKHSRILLGLAQLFGAAASRVEAGHQCWNCMFAGGLHKPYNTLSLAVCVDVRFWPKACIGPNQRLTQSVPFLPRLPVAKCLAI